MSSLDSDPIDAFQITNQSPQNRLAVYFRNDAAVAFRSQDAILSDVAMDGSYKILHWKDDRQFCVRKCKWWSNWFSWLFKIRKRDDQPFCIGGVSSPLLQQASLGILKRVIISLPMSNAVSRKIESHLAHKWDSPPTLVLAKTVRWVVRPQVSSLEFTGGTLTIDSDKERLLIRMVLSSVVSLATKLLPATTAAYSYKTTTFTADTITLVLVWWST